MRNPSWAQRERTGDCLGSTGPGAHRYGRGFARLTRMGVAVLITLGGCFLSIGLGAATQPLRGYDLKASMLVSLTRFVDWPATAFPSADSAVVIGILGDDPFGPVLDEIARHEKCGDRPIKIERYRNVETARECHLLFVSASEEAEFPRILRVLKARPIVTVGDSEGFDTRGGMIRFSNGPAGRVQLRINPDAFKAAGLAVSAKLLRLAEKTGTPKN
jgi:hypothetical protein